MAHEEYDTEFLTQGRAALAAAAQWFEYEVTPVEWLFAALFWLDESTMADARGDAEYSRACIIKCGMCMLRVIGMWSE